MEIIRIIHSIAANGESMAVDTITTITKELNAFDIYWTTNNDADVKDVTGCDEYFVFHTPKYSIFMHVLCVCFRKWNGCHANDKLQHEKWTITAVAFFWWWVQVVIDASIRLIHTRRAHSNDEIHNGNAYDNVIDRVKSTNTFVELSNSKS